MHNSRVNFYKVLVASVTMFVPEVPVPGWRLVQPVVVADEELLPGTDRPHRHDAHDVPEPGVVMLGQPSVA